MKMTQDSNKNFLTSFFSFLNGGNHPLSFILICFSLFQITISLFGILDALKFRAIHCIFLLFLCFLLYPVRRKKISLGLERNERENSNSRNRLKYIFFFWNIFCLFGSLFSFGYFLCSYDNIVINGGWLELQDYFVAALGVICSFEAARRVVPNLAVLAALFLAYVFFGQFIPGAFSHSGFSLIRTLDHLFWGSQGLLGVGIGVSSSYIFLFVLFGSVLKYSGFSRFINDLALALVGWSSGGPAKVSVFASALMGMINGSALANVATTGSITIPLMKKTGYSPEYAGAVEAVASTGGQFAPPIMGAVGFIMAEFLGVSYTKVMLAAAIPAFLYYLSLIIAVHLQAKRLGLKGLSRDNLPIVRNILREEGHLIIPLIILLALMFAGFTPTFAAAIAIFTTIIVSRFSSKTKMSLKVILRAFKEGAENALGVGISCLIIGVIIGSVSLTGLGLSFAFQTLKFVGENQIYFGGLLVMLLSTILGMGVPGVAAYVIVASVAVPILTKLGVEPMSAHMFCLFYACLSNITPPVAMSSYVAAGIAQSNETKTSLIAMRLGLTGFLLPFFFLNNSLLLYSAEHPLWATIWAFLSACFGVAALTAGLEGQVRIPCSVIERIFLLIGAGCMIAPGIITDGIGFVLILIAGLKNFTRH